MFILNIGFFNSWQKCIDFPDLPVYKSWFIFQRNKDLTSLKGRLIISLA
jgi:hypothetical protein